MQIGVPVVSAGDDVAAVGRSAAFWPHFAGRLALAKPSPRIRWDAKHYRRIATRFEKTACSFFSMLSLAAAMIWLR